MLLIKGGRVFDVVRSEAYIADILVKDGVIAAMGENLAAEGAEIFDAAGLNIYPGFIEAHGHIGLDGYGIGYEGRDYNEYNDPVTPHLRAIDGIQPRDPAWKMARDHGVTCMNVGPGSSNVLGGTFAAVKPVGSRVEDMLVNPMTAMKCAFGENPKRCYKDKAISTRMSTAAKLRETLFKAREYMEKLDAAGDDAAKKPAFDMKLNAMLPVLRGEIPLKAHAHQADDLFTALRIAKEFGVKITLEHCTEGHLVAEALAEENVYMAVGPTLTNASKFELRDKSWETPGVLQRAGCHVSIITDSPVIPQQYLPICAGLAVEAGMDPFEALKAITIHPAEHIGAAHRIGSLEVGKDADIVITDGCPFEIGTEYKAVFIDGERVK